MENIQVIQGPYIKYLVHTMTIKCFLIHSNKFTFMETLHELKFRLLIK